MGMGRHAPIWASGSTIRENSGDMLDRIKAPRVFLSATAEPVTIKRNEKNLEFQTQGRGDVRFVEDSMPSWRG